MKTYTHEQLLIRVAVYFQKKQRLYKLNQGSETQMPRTIIETEKVSCGNNPRGLQGADGPLQVAARSPFLQDTPRWECGRVWTEQLSFQRNLGSSFSGDEETNRNFSVWSHNSNNYSYDPIQRVPPQRNVSKNKHAQNQRIQLTEISKGFHVP